MDAPQPGCVPFLPVPAAQGALLKDLDLVRWLEKKLADRERWAGRGCASFVSREMVDELMTCFSSVDHTTKMKVILSFLYLTPRNSKQWRNSLSGLLNIARRDPDDWVEVISDLLRDVPMAGGTKPVTTDDIMSYRKMIDDLVNCATTHEVAGNLRTEPPSFVACNADVVAGLFGNAPEPPKHFTLKKKSKSHNLFMDIQKQCEHLVSSKKERKEAIVAGSLPIRIRSTRREANNDLPMKGIPTANTVKMSQGFSNEPKKFQRTLAKREGGAKLLDIGDLPVPLKQRRRAEMDDERSKAKEEKEQQKRAAAEERKAAADAKRVTVTKVKDETRNTMDRKVEQRKAPEALSTLKDLSSPIRPTNNQGMSATLEGRRVSQHFSSSLVSPTRAGPNTSQPNHTSPQSDSVSQPKNAHDQSHGHHQNHQDQIHHQQQQLQMQQQQRHVPQQQSHQIQQQQQVQQMRLQQQQLPQVHVQNQMQGQHRQQQQVHPQLHQQTIQQHVSNPMGSSAIQHQAQQQSYSTQRPVIVRNFPGQMNPIAIPGSSGVQIVQQQQPQQYFVAMQQNQGYGDFQDMEVAKKCQEILATANALEEKGRSLVLQFMKGGLRCAPSPSMDHIMTLKLSENVEDGLIDGRLQKLKVEVFFQMDLSNGEWKRLRKCRMLEGDELNTMMGNQQQPQQSWNNQQQFSQPNFGHH